MRTARPKIVCCGPRGVSYTSRSLFQVSQTLAHFTRKRPWSDNISPEMTPPLENLFQSPKDWDHFFKNRFLPNNSSESTEFLETSPIVNCWICAWEDTTSSAVTLRRIFFVEGISKWDDTRVSWHIWWGISDNIKPSQNAMSTWIRSETNMAFQNVACEMRLLQNMLCHTALLTNPGKLWMITDNKPICAFEQKQSFLSTAVLWIVANFSSFKKQTWQFLLFFPSFEVSKFSLLTELDMGIVLPDVLPLSSNCQRQQPPCWLLLNRKQACTHNVPCLLCCLWKIMLSCPQESCRFSRLTISKIKTLLRVRQS